MDSGAVAADSTETLTDLAQSASPMAHPATTSGATVQWLVITMFSTL